MTVDCILHSWSIKQFVSILFQSIWIVLGWGGCAITKQQDFGGDFLFRSVLNLILNFFFFILLNHHKGFPWSSRRSTFVVRSNIEHQKQRQNIYNRNSRLVTISVGVHTVIVTVLYYSTRW